MIAHRADPGRAALRPAFQHDAQRHRQGPVRRPARQRAGRRRRHAGSAQPSHAQTPRPITHSRSAPASQGSSSVNMVTAWR